MASGQEGVSECATWVAEQADGTCLSSSSCPAGIFLLMDASGDPTPRPKPGKRRRRPALACVSCRQSKIRCDRNWPCGACTRSRHRECVFGPDPGLGARAPGPSALPALADAAGLAPAPAPAPAPARPRRDPRPQRGARSPAAAPLSPSAASLLRCGPSPEGPRDSSAPSPSGWALAGSASSRGDELSGRRVDALVERVKELERLLEDAIAANPQQQQRGRQPQSRPPVAASPISSMVLRAPDKGAQNHPSGGLAYDLEVHTMHRSVMAKTRYFGASHWMNLVVFMKPLIEVFESQPEHLQCKVTAVLSRAKTVARAIKASRLPTLSFNFGHEIPPRVIADQLVEGYLRTYESVYRVLHVPSFRAEYEKFWEHPPASAHSAFLIQLQLVMAVGSAVYDSVHSQRSLALRWVYEAQCWLLKPPHKSKLTLMGLQNMILLCLARESAAVGADLVWIDVGSLVRSAILMGLHRDPRHLPPTNRLVSEMRRRLWNTIFEISLNSSLVSGGPPLILLDDTDTSGPDDCDDAVLDETCQDDGRLPKQSVITDMSAALALRQSFPLRLAIARLLNDVGSKGGRYEDTLRLSSQLQSMYRTVIASMKTSGSLGNRQLTAFQQDYVEFVFRRCLLSLHVPYLGLAIQDPVYAFSRTTAVEMALKLYCTASPQASFNQRGEATEVASPTPSTDLSRLCDCTAGTLRGIIGQAIMVLVTELCTQVHENRNGFCLSPPRPDLLRAFRDMRSWSLRRVQAGETNIKAYVILSGMSKYIEGLLSGLDPETLYQASVEAAVTGFEEMLDMLKGHIRDDAADTSAMDFDDTSGMNVTFDMELANTFFDITGIPDFAFHSDDSFEFPQFTT